MCNECDKGFLHIKNLQRHKKQFHTDYHCPDCGEEFQKRSVYKKHRLLQHKKPITYKCSECSAAFQEEATLEKHQKTHPDNPLKCKICHRHFESESALEEHQKMHTDSSHTCDGCSRVFPLLQGLRTHYKSCSSIPKDIKVRTPKNTKKPASAKDDPLKCKLCKKQCESEDALQEHQKMHTSSSHTCEECNRSFPSVLGLRYHYRSCEQIQKNRHLLATEIVTPDVFSCEDCGESFSTKLKLKIHRYKHTGVFAHKCEHCEMIFSAGFALRKHQREEHGIEHPEDQKKKCVCEVCGKLCRNKSTLILHMRTHTKEKPYICNVCDRAFTSNKGLNEHKRIHNDEKPYSCNACPKAFRTLTALQLHVTIHTGEKPFACSVCDKRFRLKQVLTQHLAGVHNQGDDKTRASFALKKKKMYACKYCDREYPNYNSCRAHEESVHLGVTYTCDQCGRVFNQKNNFKRHIATVHGKLKKFTCDVCGQAFAQRATLKFHQRTHTGEKGFKCDLCPAAYADPRGLKRHKEREHQQHSDREPGFGTEPIQSSHTGKVHMSLSQVKEQPGIERAQNLSLMENANPFFDRGHAWIHSEPRKETTSLIGREDQPLVGREQIGNMHVPLMHPHILNLSHNSSMQ